MRPKRSFSSTARAEDGLFNQTPCNNTAHYFATSVPRSKPTVTGFSTTVKNFNKPHRLPIEKPPMVPLVGPG